jgi:hypothetical protein
MRMIPQLPETYRAMMRNWAWLPGWQCSFDRLTDAVR